MGPFFLTTVRQAPLTATLLPIFRCRVTAAWSMPTRPCLASTTLATALTIPVNTWVCADEDVISEAGEIDVAYLSGIVSILHSVSPQRARGGLFPPQPLLDLHGNLVDPALRRKVWLHP